MRRLAVLAAVVAWIALRARSHAPAASRSAAASRAGTAGADPAGRGVHPVDRVRQLASADERRAVADRITEAHDRRAALHIVAPPSLPTLSTDDLQAAATTLRAAMREVVPHLSDCYGAAGSTVPDELAVGAKLVLTGNPDVGTLIDARELRTAGGAALPAAFDDCVRDALESLELPPLAEGDVLDVSYPFVFRR